MSSQESVHDSPATVTPELGEGTLDTWRFHRQRGGRTQSRHPADACGGTRLWANHGGRGVCEPALEPHRRWEGLWKKGQGFKPDLGNPAVRDYRGATGNVSHGGTVNPSCNRKSRNGNPPPKAGRARALSQLSVGRAIELRKTLIGALNPISDGEGNTAGHCRSRVISRPCVV